MGELKERVVTELQEINEKEKENSKTRRIGKNDMREREMI